MQSTFAFNLVKCVIICLPSVKIFGLKLPAIDHLWFRIQVLAAMLVRKTKSQTKQYNEMFLLKFLQHGHRDITCEPPIVFSLPIGPNVSWIFNEMFARNRSVRLWPFFELPGNDQYVDTYILLNDFGDTMGSNLTSFKRIFLIPELKGKEKWEMRVRSYYYTKTIQ